MTTTTNDARKRRDARRKAFLAVLARLPGWFYVPPVINFGAKKDAFMYPFTGQGRVTMAENGDFTYESGDNVVTGLNACQVVDMATNAATRRAVLTATPAMVANYHALAAAGRFGHVGGLPLGI